MNQQRRDMLRFSAVMGLAVAAGLIKPEEARAAEAHWNKAAFSTRSVADTVKALGGTGTSPSDLVVLTAPDIAALLLGDLLGIRRPDGVLASIAAVSAAFADEGRPIFR